MSISDNAPSAPLRLSYPELAQRLGISLDAARIRARRKGWPVEKGNDGRRVVLVWPHELTAELDRSVSSPSTDGDETNAILLAELTRIRAEHLAALEKVAKGEKRIAEESQRAAVAEARMEEMNKRMEERRIELDRLHQQLEELRRPWWQRLLRSRLN